MVLEKAQELAQVSGKTFKNSLPSQKWWSGFKARNPEIRLRKLKAMSRAAKQAASRDVLDAFYADLDSICKEYGIGPENTFNMDESGLENLGGRSNVVVGADQEHATSVVSTTNEHVTIIACVNALGTVRLPPLFLFQGTEGGMPKNNLLPGCPDNWMAAYTGHFVVHVTNFASFAAKGWITTLTFFGWLDVFIGATKPTAEHPVLLIVDNHSSRYNVEMLEYAMQNHVIMLSLPPNTTNLLQPLDVGVFGPFKRAAHKAIDASTARGENPLSRQNIGRMILPVWNAHVNMGNIQAGFRKSGIFPLDRLAIGDTFLAQPESSAFASSSSVSAQPQTQLSFEHILKLRQAAASEKDAGKPASKSLLLSHVGRVSMSALLSGKTTELDILPEHLKGVLVAPEWAKDGVKTGKKGKKASRARILTSKSFTDHLRDKRDKEEKERKAKDERKQQRAEKKQKAAQEKAEKKEKAAQKKVERDAKKKAKAEAAAKRKRIRKDALAAQAKSKTARKEQKAKDKAEGKERKKSKGARRGAGSGRARGRGAVSRKRKRDSDSDSDSDYNSSDAEQSESSSESEHEDKQQSDASNSSASASVGIERKQPGDSKSMDTSADSTLRFEKGHAIIELEPEDSDPRPIGLVRVLNDVAKTGHDKDTDPVRVEIWMPEDKTDLIGSEYKRAIPADSKGSRKRDADDSSGVQTEVLAGSLSWHSFNLENGCLPVDVRGPAKRYYQKELKVYKHVIGLA